MGLGGGGGVVEDTEGQTASSPYDGSGARPCDSYGGGGVTIFEVPYCDSYYAGILLFGVYIRGL